MTRDYPDRPLIGVGAVVLKGDQVLLIKRRNPPLAGRWSLPGGLQRLGETVFAAAAREVLEETGVLARIEGVIDVVDFIDPASNEDGVIRYHYTLIDMLAVWQAGDAAPGDDAESVIWTNPKALVDFNLWSETERIIRMALSGTKILA